ncbi:glycerol-3-phosphate dehydrogenase [Arthrobacter bambusae]|uniref:Glycerol-3-phosphate dehydrogenase n=1 Tax=Arthrobacter bambusae TaxID=1338426 RepID=A0ABV2P5L8_9MICC
MFISASWTGLRPLIESRQEDDDGGAAAVVVVS